MDREIINYLPPILREVEDFKAINAAENFEFTKLWKEISAILDNCFLSTASESGVERLEKILGITPKGSDDLNVRKFRLYAALSESTPITLSSLKRQLADLCGEDGFSINLSGFTLSVALALDVAKLYDEVEKLIKRTIPANLLLLLSLMYNIHSKFLAYTHNSLKTYTYTNLRSKDI